MSTSIPWTNETWNPLVGCSRISAGCKNCYAADAAKSARLQQFPQYQTVADWDGTILFVENQLLKPLSWKSPKRVFVCSMSDIFHANVKDKWIDRIFAVMAIASQHTFQILTKRPERMKEYFSDRNRARWICDRALDILRDEENPTQWKFKIHGDRLNVKIPLPNVWLGVSIENHQAATDRIPHLINTPAAIHFLSCEPLIGPVYLHNFYESVPGDCWSTWIDYLDWVIVGGESGSGARPCDLQWIRGLVKECEYSETAVFVKQLGSMPIDNGNKLKLKNRKGGKIYEFPDDLKIREFPEL